MLPRHRGTRRGASQTRGLTRCSPTPGTTLPRHRGRRAWSLPGRSARTGAARIPGVSRDFWPRGRRTRAPSDSTSRCPPARGEHAERAAALFAVAPEWRPRTCCARRAGNTMRSVHTVGGVDGLPGCSRGDLGGTMVCVAPPPSPGSQGRKHALSTDLGAHQGGRAGRPAGRSPAPLRCRLMGVAAGGGPRPPSAPARVPAGPLGTNPHSSTGHRPDPVCPRALASLSLPIRDAEIPTSCQAGC